MNYMNGCPWFVVPSHEQSRVGEINIHPKRLVRADVDWVGARRALKQMRKYEGIYIRERERERGRDF